MESSWITVWSGQLADFLMAHRPRYPSPVQFASASFSSVSQLVTAKPACYALFNAIRTSANDVAVTPVAITPSWPRSSTWNTTVPFGIGKSCG